MTGISDSVSTLTIAIICMVIFYLFDSYPQVIFLVYGGGHGDGCLV